MYMDGGFDQLQSMVHFRVFTSYFARLKAVEAAGLVPVSICLKPPDWYHGLQYKKLAPTWGCLSDYKKDGDEKKYIRRYAKETLHGLALGDVLMELWQLSGGRSVALLCYERPEQFCHRHVFVDWANDWAANLKIVHRWQEDWTVTEFDGDIEEV